MLSANTFGLSRLFLMEAQVSKLSEILGDGWEITDDAEADYRRITGCTKSRSHIEKKVAAAIIRNVKMVARETGGSVFYRGNSLFDVVVRDFTVVAVVPSKKTSDYSGKLRFFPGDATISKHAIQRYYERSGFNGTETGAINRITKVFERGLQVIPVNPAAKIVNNRMNLAKYYAFGGLVAVFCNNTIVTVKPHIRGEFHGSEWQSYRRFTVKPVDQWAQL